MEIKSTMIEAHVFRINNNDLDFLILKRSMKEIYPGLWQMVTGSVNEGEKAYETAYREIIEETSLIPSKMWIAPIVNSFYSERKDSVIMVPVFAALIENNFHVNISDEHSDFKWVKLEEAVELFAWDGQRRAAKIIKEYFLNKQSYLKFVELKI